jgi:protoporphyrin/coproporphyrin ferrochelatase
VYQVPMTELPDAKPADILAIVVLNLGGPDSLDAVEPYLRNLFSDPDVIQLGWLRPLQPLMARIMARRRAPVARDAYQQIGGRSPIIAESTDQAKAIAAELVARGHAALPFVAMACWRPFSADAVAAMRAAGIQRAIAVPLYPHYSVTTTGSSFKALDRALAGVPAIQLARVRHYADAPGYIEAIGDRIDEAIATLPEEHRATAPVVFSAHGLPEAYIRRGDPYLDEIRTTVSAATQRLGLGGRAQLAFQSQLGRQKWLGPCTEDALDALATAGHKAVVVCPVAFTGEHIETLQEIDILYRERARKRGIIHFARAHTVGCHPAFIATLAGLAESAAREMDWA